MNIEVEKNSLDRENSHTGYNKTTQLEFKKEKCKV